MKCDIWCNKLAELRSTQIWREIRKIKTPTSKTVNPKLETNRLVDQFTTRTDQTTLPKNIITALKPLIQTGCLPSKNSRPYLEDTKRQPPERMALARPFTPQPHVPVRRESSIYSINPGLKENYQNNGRRQ